jgi:uncharacterized protein
MPGHDVTEESGSVANRLAQETSPYLQQHAENPVDWYPWGPEAFEAARARDVPILLSIGYSACHWCHVMEHESFDDPDTAARMNELFVSVKVDREERPDVDSIYMRAVQSLTGHGGWPLTVFLMPDGRPFYGATYLPPIPRQGMPSFQQIMTAVSDAYQSRRDQVEASASNIRELLERSTRERALGPDPEAPTDEPGLRLIDDAAATISAHFDPAHGGFGRAPKFPQPDTLEFLLRSRARPRGERILEMVMHTLRRMAAGGIHDQIGGGFHRYSVDTRWLVPHFEKMLYDNALLARLYLNAFQVTDDDRLRVVAEATLDYIAADLRSPEGGFFSARDADSEGEEGIFYMWTPEQVEDVLGEEEAQLFNRCYDISSSGNFEGRNIPNLPHDLSAIAASMDIDPERLEERLASARGLLIEARAEREHPFRDEKILASWNGMAVRAFAEAGVVLGRDDYLGVAEEAAAFLVGNLRNGDRLLRVYKNGAAKIDAFLEDYGALGNALLTLHEATLDPRWLDEVRWMVERMLARFWDEDERAFFDTSAEGEALVVRPREITDSATPSGNSLAAELLLRAGHLFGEERWVELATEVIGRETGSVARFPAAFGRLLSAMFWLVEPSQEIAIIGDRTVEATTALLREAWIPFRNGRVIGGGAPDTLPSIPLFAGRGLLEGRPAAYVCEHFTCRAPVSEPEALAEQLRTAD